MRNKVSSDSMLVTRRKAFRNAILGPPLFACCLRDDRIPDSQFAAGFHPQKTIRVSTLRDDHQVGIERKAPQVVRIEIVGFKHPACRPLG